ncbi:hypothetical protein lbkm_4224 [Lachnospiraceae bacterium KM106-2]|nr:hypothetical protein lbkm_4224 [Lachnospiraceae bacterium KM106-2]
MKNQEELVKIYLKIHNKCSLTFDELVYLSKFNPDCFEKTCNNLVSDVPVTKEILNPVIVVENEESLTEKEIQIDQIEKVLQNLKDMENDKFPVGEISSDTVKRLLGELYMEELLTNSDHNSYFKYELSRTIGMFDQMV